MAKLGLIFQKRTTGFRSASRENGPEAETTIALNRTIFKKETIDKTITFHIGTY
jgi:hypothetical protein